MGIEPLFNILLSIILIILPALLPKESPITEWSKETFPNPHRHVYDCGQRGRRSNVCDPNGIISYDEAVSLDQMIDSLKELPCPCDVCPGGKRGGYSIGIAFMAKLKFEAEYEGSPITNKQRMLQVEQFAVYLRDKRWNFGICNNDVIIVIVNDLGIVYVSTGSIARYKVTNQCLAESNSEAEPAFKARNYTQGLKQLLRHFKQYFTIGGPCTAGSGDKDDWPIEAIVGVVTGTCVFFIVCCVTLTRFCSGAGAAGGGGSHRHHYSAYNRGQKEQKEGFQTKVFEADNVLIDAMIEEQENETRSKDHMV